MCDRCDKTQGRTDVPDPRDRVEPVNMAGGGVRSMNDDELLNEIFRYHAPDRMAAQKYENIREAARHFAKVLMMNTPFSADRTCALRHVRDAVMTANSAVALNGLSF